MFYKHGIDRRKAFWDGSKCCNLGKEYTLRKEKILPENEGKKTIDKLMQCVVLKISKHDNRKNFMRSDRLP